MNVGAINEFGAVVTSKQVESISVIVPFYNAEKYIEQCLNGLINQTVKNFEIILVDDGSTDSTQEIISSKYLSLYNIIHYVYQNNQGVSVARNKGIELARNEYVIFVDADDLLEPDFIENFMIFTKNKIDLVCCSYYIDYPNNNRSFLKKIDKKILDNNTDQTVFEIDKLGMLNVVWNKMFKKSILINNKLFFDSKLKSGEDLVFVLNYCQYINSIKIISKPLYHYLRVEKQSTLMRYIKNLDKNLEISWKARQDFYSKSNVGKNNYEYFLERIYLSEKISILNNAYRPDAPYKERKKIIKCLLNDIRLSIIFESVKPNSFSEKIFFYTVKKGSISLMITIYNFLFFFRNKFSWFYSKIRFKII